MCRRILWSAIVTLIPWTFASAQNDAVRLTEDFRKDSQYHVACQVEITGTLTLAADAKSAPRSLKVFGKSSIKYDERILSLKADRSVERTVRYYRQLEFDRKIGDEEQQ